MNGTMQLEPVEASTVQATLRAREGDMVKKTRWAMRRHEKGSQTI